jgi:hypothetical protein
MKSLLLAATALVFAATINLSPASAAKLLEATPGQLFPQADASGSPANGVRTPHYEWQYSYVGHHPRYQGHWVLVR